MSLTEQNNPIVHVDDVFDDGFLRVEHRNYYVACGGTPLKLPRTEFLIFSRLTRTPDRIVTAEDLWSSVWGSNKPLNSESLHVYIYRLRAKLAVPNPGAAHSTQELDSRSVCPKLMMRE